MSWIPSYKKPGGSGGIEIVDWSTGTDEQISAMLDAHYAGQIDVTEYWAVGDERTISLSAMSIVGGGSAAAQDVTFVLSNIGGKTLADGVTTCAFQVDQKDCLNLYGYMNSSNTNTGGWKNSAARTWCNNDFKNAIPSTLLPIFKEFINQSGTGGGSSSGVENTTDTFALRAEVEVFNSTTYSVSGEGRWISWYCSSLNTYKHYKGSTCTYWFRSPYRGNPLQFCAGGTNGATAYSIATSKNGLAPFGVI